MTDDFMTVAEAKKLYEQMHKEAKFVHSVMNADRILDKFNSDLQSVMDMLIEQNDRNIALYDKLKKITKSIREVKNESK